MTKRSRDRPSSSVAASAFTGEANDTSYDDSDPCRTFSKRPKVCCGVMCYGMLLTHDSGYFPVK